MPPVRSGRLWTIGYRTRNDTDLLDISILMREPDRDDLVGWRIYLEWKSERTGIPLEPVEFLCPLTRLTVCVTCGRKDTPYLCDYPLMDVAESALLGTSATCDVDICADCAFKVGWNRHYCPRHYEIAHGLPYRLLDSDRAPEAEG